MVLIISYPALKRLYEENLTVARWLEVPQTREEQVEIDRRRQWYVVSFLLYLVGSTLFTNKTNIPIDMVYLDCMVDLNAIGKWSWGEMILAYLYDYLDDFVCPCNKTMAGCVTFMMVINLRVKYVFGPYNIGNF